ncbi:MAG TPA: hypothetical protein DDZ80_06800 [Cyanobacteria bacterium UBA8803]|nr:hypothetical protein [Cyanobacteria bacterium UBA8803]
MKHHKELNAFLLERGVYLVSDWAILNDTSSKQLQRIFSEFHQLTPFEIKQASQLLESYHAVYRAQRLQQRQAGIGGRCLPPTTEQLQEMAQRLATQTAQIYRPETVMAKLQAIASRLRQYRIYVRGGSLPTESIDTHIPSETSGRIKFRDFNDNRNTTDEQTEFLSLYRQQVLLSLDQAIAKVTQEYVRRLKCQDPTKAQNFITALQLFHTEGLSMGEIAKRLNLKAQFQVTRLLKLKAFRADVQQEFLSFLRDRVIHKAKAYTDSGHLQAYSAQIVAALEEQVSAIIQEAATEASTPNCAKTSLFAERVCCYLASPT